MLGLGGIFLKFFHKNLHRNMLAQGIPPLAGAGGHPPRGRPARPGMQGTPPAGSACAAGAPFLFRKEMGERKSWNDGGKGGNALIWFPPASIADRREPKESAAGNYSRSRGPRKPHQPPSPGSRAGALASLCYFLQTEKVGPRGSGPPEAPPMGGGPPHHLTPGGGRRPSGRVRDP